MYLIQHLVVGGAQNLVRQYAEKIDKDKFDVVVVCGDNRTGSFVDQSLEDNNIRVIYLGDLVGDDRFESKSIEKYQAFQEVYYAEKPDVIHTHIDMNDYLLTVDTLADDVKLFHTIHRDPKYLIEEQKLHVSRMRKLIDERNLTPITLHDKMNAHAQEIFETDRTELVQNGLDIPQFQQPLINGDEMRRRNGIPEDAYVVGTISRLDPVKNHNRLLEVFNVLLAKKPNAALVIVGDGDIRDSLEVYAGKLGIEESVHFLGERKDTPELLGMMDAFVFPSILEAFPGAVMEAQAAGVECFVSDGVPRSMELTNYIHWISLDDSDEVWAETILNTHTKDKQFQGIEHYDIQKSVEHLEKLYAAPSFVYEPVS